MNSVTSESNSAGEGNIKSSSDPVEGVKAWIAAMSKRGMYGPESARLRATSITQLTSVLGPEEPRDPASILGNIEDLGRRYARSKNGKPDTVSTYVSRAKVTLQDFLTYQEDPTKFKGSPVGARSSVKPAREKAQVERAKVVETMEIVAATTASSSPPPSSSAQSAAEKTSIPEIRPFPLDATGRVFLYGLPSDGVVHFREVAKIFCHLISFAPDFDPTNSTHADFYFKALSAVNRTPDDMQRR